jgi:porphobilinogen synthase
MVRETRLAKKELVQPLFIIPGSGRKESAPGLPGIIRLTPDMTIPHAEDLLAKGIEALLLFGVAERKDPQGSGAWSEKNPVFQAVRGIKSSLPEITVIVDICLCAYTTEGHCGVEEGGVLQRDKTVELLGKMAVAAAFSGADMVAPSAMMDGMVAGIRHALDEAGFPMLPIMSYSAKFASAFYRPFRDAAESTPRKGDRRGYQLDPGNRREALREIKCDAEEGADVVMIKPALPYLDLISTANELTHLPVAAYNVSGEYAMVKAAVRQGWVVEKDAVAEILTSIKRAGAKIIITYHASEACAWLD